MARDGKSNLDGFARSYKVNNKADFSLAMGMMGSKEVLGVEEGKRNLIILDNTKDITSATLRKAYSLYKNIDIRVLGGYTEDFLKVYEGSEDVDLLQSVTYCLPKLIKIVDGMEKIESHIDRSWDNMQKAMYLYEVLKYTFPYDARGEKGAGKYGNLEALGLTEKMGAVAIGYSQMYKELCDRQGIKCDMVVGGYDSKAVNKQHVWNVIEVDGNRYLVDIEHANYVASYGDDMANTKDSTDDFAYTGDRLASYKPADDESYNNLACLPGMVKHMVNKSIHANVNDAVVDMYDALLHGSNAVMGE